MSSSTSSECFVELSSTYDFRQKVFEIDDVMLHIIKYLSFNDIATLSRTSKRFQVLCRKQLMSRRSLIVASKRLFTDYNGNTLYPNSEKANKRITIVVPFEKFLTIARDYMPNIRRLCLELSNDVNNDNFVLIGKYLQNLKELWLFRGSSNLTEAGFSKAFEEFHNLKRLHILHANIKSSFLRNMPAVEELSLFDNYDDPDYGDYNYDDEYYFFERLQHSLRKLRFHAENPNPGRLLESLQNLTELIFCVKNRNQFNTLLDVFCERNTLKSLKLMIYSYDEPHRSYLPVCHSVTYLAIDIPFVDENDLIQIFGCFPNIEVLSISMVNILQKKRQKLFRSLNNGVLKELNLIDPNIDVMRDSRALEKAFLGITEIQSIKKLRIGLFDKSFINPFICSLEYYFQTNPENNIQIQLIIGGLCMRVANARPIKVPNTRKIKIIGWRKRKIVKFGKFFPTPFYKK